MLISRRVYGISDARPEWRVGITFAPFTEEEWAHFTWSPLWRIEMDQADSVTARGVSTLLVAKALDDPSIDALLPFLSRPGVWGIELGNEPNWSGNPAVGNAWYLRTIQRLRAAGFTGVIVTAGVANINGDTLAWAAESIQGLPADVVFGWHAYSDWQGQLATLTTMLNGRPHAMTESGYPNDTGYEDYIARLHASAIVDVKASGALTYIAYQMHDGPPGTSESTCGVHAWDGHWRPFEQSLMAAAAPVPSPLPTPTHPTSSSSGGPMITVTTQPFGTQGAFGVERMGDPMPSPSDPRLYVMVHPYPLSEQADPNVRTYASWTAGATGWKSLPVRPDGTFDPSCLFQFSVPLNSNPANREGSCIMHAEVTGIGPVQWVATFGLF